MDDPLILGVMSKFTHAAFALGATFFSGVIVGARLAYRRISQLSMVNPLEIMVHLFVASLLILAGAFAFSQLPTESDAVLGDYTSPALVLTTVDGVDGPAVREHGLLTVRQVLCIESDVLTKVVAIRGFVNIADSDSPIYDLAAVEQNRAPGCTTTDIPITLPENVTAGTWIVAGEDRTTDGAEVRRWTSQPFRVVEGP